MSLLLKIQMGKIGKILLGAGLIWYGVLRGASAMVVRLYSWTLQAIDIANGMISAQLNIFVQNPLFVGITIKRISGDIYLNGDKVGYIDHELNYHLAAGKSQIVPVSINVDSSASVNTVLNNMLNGTKGVYTFAFDGKLYIGSKNVGVPLQFSFDWDGAGVI